MRPVDVEAAIRARRTHKRYGSEPLDRATLLDLLDLARWAPNHHLTEPWRFHVLGPETVARLKEVAGEKEAMKLGRAPTLVVATAKLSGDAVQDEEDLHAVACAVYAVLLAATARGLASYWRTPAVLRDRAACLALGLPDDERVVALLHFGTPLSDPPVKERRPVDAFTSLLP